MSDKRGGGAAACCIGMNKQWMVGGSAARFNMQKGINKSSDSEDKDGVFSAMEHTHTPGNKQISELVEIETGPPLSTFASCPCITFFP